MVAVNLPLHLFSIISIEAVSYSKWTVLTWHFLAPEAGACVIKMHSISVLSCSFLNSSLPISNYWKWKRFCQSVLNCQFGIFKCLHLPQRDQRGNGGIPKHFQFSTWVTRGIPTVTCLITEIHLAFTFALHCCWWKAQSQSLTNRGCLLSARGAFQCMHV